MAAAALILAQHRSTLRSREDNYSRVKNINFLPGLHRFRSSGFSMPECHAERRVFNRCPASIQRDKSHSPLWA